MFCGPCLPVTLQEVYMGALIAGLPVEVHAVYKGVLMAMFNSYTTVGVYGSIDSCACLLKYMQCIREC